MDECNFQRNGQIGIFGTKLLMTVRDQFFSGNKIKIEDDKGVTIDDVIQFPAGFSWMTADPNMT